MQGTEWQTCLNHRHIYAIGNIKNVLRRTDIYLSFTSMQNKWSSRLMMGLTFAIILSKEQVDINLAGT